VVDDQARSWSLPAPVGDELEVQVDTGVPHIARIYNYWLGGTDNFAADREAAELFIASYPDIRVGVRAQREFLARAVTFLAYEVGIRQFLDIGTGLPSANNTHEIAQRIAPDARVVYIDNDPIVLTHARDLLTGSPAGTTAYLDADLRDTGAIAAAAARTLDFTKPVGIVLIGVMQCIPDSDDPGGVVSRLLDAVPSGRYLVLAHPTSDVQPAQMSSGVSQLNALLTQPVTLRTHEEISALFDGTDLVLPGLVQLHRWRGVEADPAAELELAAYAGIARKP
jgi:hypothetical protein